MVRTIILAIGDDGKTQIIEGGEVSPAIGLAVCQGAADFYRQKVIDVEVERRVKEAKTQPVETEAETPVETVTAQPIS